MLSFEFATASRIIFGAGKLNELGKQLGTPPAKRVLLVCGYSSDAISRVKEMQKCRIANILLPTSTWPASTAIW